MYLYFNSIVYYFFFRYIFDNNYVDRDFDDDLSKITESSTPVETPDE